MTKEIIIPWNDEVFTVLVDDDSYTLLNRHTWYIMFSGKDKRPYAFTEVFSKTQGKRMVYMHHLILGAYRMTDHANNNSLDNQFDNLRPATNSQNGINTPKYGFRDGRKTSSKYKGVCWDKRQQKWVAKIKRDKKFYNLGTFTDEDKAGLAYNKKALELYGEFAWLNPIEINHPVRTRESGVDNG
jgi:hypothetical protein